MRPRNLSGDKFKPSDHKKRVLGPECPNMVIWAQTPRKKHFRDCYAITRNVLQIRFQRALNNYQVISLSQYITKNMFLAPNAQIW